MVWAATTYVGCGLSFCPSVGDTGATFWVCRYSGRGNVIGAFSSNVKPATLTSSACDWAKAGSRARGLYACKLMPLRRGPCTFPSAMLY